MDYRLLLACSSSLVHGVLREAYIAFHSSTSAGETGGAVLPQLPRMKVRIEASSSFDMVAPAGGIMPVYRAAGIHRVRDDDVDREERRENGDSTSNGNGAEEKPMDETKDEGANSAAEGAEDKKDEETDGASNKWE